MRHRAVVIRRRYSVVGGVTRRFVNKFGGGGCTGRVVHALALVLGHHVHVGGAHAVLPGRIIILGVFTSFSWLLVRRYWAQDVIVVIIVAVSYLRISVGFDARRNHDTLM